MKLNIKKLQQELMNVATSSKTAEQLSKVELKTLYLAVYSLNTLRLVNKKESK